MKSLKYFETLLGSDANGVRRIARALKVQRFKQGKIELYDEEQMMKGMSGHTEKMKKRTITKAHQAAMQAGKNKKK